MWFDDWSDIVRVLIVGTAAYVGLVALLRISGKRTLAKLNAFDLVVTVAFGSTLATILLSSDVSYAEGVTAQHPQDLQAQGVSARLEDRCQGVHGGQFVSMCIE